MQLRSLALTTLALAGTSLAAQEGPRFGVQVTLNQPQSDLKDAVDSKLGYGLGAHLAVDLNGGHMLRPRFDATWYPERKESDAFGSFSTKFSSMSLGMDYLYHFGGKSEGVYLTVGAAAAQWKVEWNATATGFFSDSGSEKTTKLALSAGLGYQFNKTFGGELRYVKGKAWEGNVNSIQLGATFRF